MSQVSIQRALEDGLAKENRRILSDWRALIVLRRASQNIAAEHRRWSKSPASLHEVRSILGRLAAQGHLRPLDGLPHFYEVASPFARKTPVHEYELIMEVHPFAALSHASALSFHSLTQDFSNDTHVTIPAPSAERLVPLGTAPEDWRDLETGSALVIGREPKMLLDRSIQWHRLSTGVSPAFGFGQYEPFGYPVRVTTVERTLLDGLRHPEWCGGIENVLRAWHMARDIVDLNALVGLTDTLEVAILRQRVGFVLDELKLVHPALEAWQSLAHRGGSSKLSGAAPFAPTFSERWKLSINAPISALHGQQS